MRQIRIADPVRFQVLHANVMPGVARAQGAAVARRGIQSIRCAAANVQANAGPAAGYHGATRSATGCGTIDHRKK